MANITLQNGTKIEGISDALIRDLVGIGYEVKDAVVTPTAKKVFPVEKRMSTQKRLAQGNAHRGLKFRRRGKAGRTKTKYILESVHVGTRTGLRVDGSPAEFAFARMRNLTTGKTSDKAVAEVLGHKWIQVGK